MNYRKWEKNLIVHCDNNHKVIHNNMKDKPGKQLIVDLSYTASCLEKRILSQEYEIFKLVEKRAQNRECLARVNERIRHKNRIKELQDKFNEDVKLETERHANFQAFK